MNSGLPTETFTDPRIGRSYLVIRQAALAELAEAGYGGFRIESVARRAGVGKSTIYRHWGNKIALIGDALETLNEQPGLEVGGGTPRERVEHLLRHLVDAVSDSSVSACIPALIHAAEQDPSVREFFHGYSAQRRRPLVLAISDGVAGGDFPADLDADLASLALSGAIFFRRLMTDEPFDPSLVPALINTVVGTGGRSNDSDGA